MDELEEQQQRARAVAIEALYEARSAVIAWLAIDPSNGQADAAYRSLYTAIGYATEQPLYHVPRPDRV